MDSVQNLRYSSKTCQDLMLVNFPCMCVRVYTRTNLKLKVGGRNQFVYSGNTKFIYTARLDQKAIFCISE
jgi:hypothetical protein